MFGVERNDSFRGSLGAVQTFAGQDLYPSVQENIVSSNALAAITLMTTTSKPEEKETIIQLVTNMLDDSSTRN